MLYAGKPVHRSGSPAPLHPPRRGLVSTANIKKLPGLAIAILEEALRHSREMSQSEVGTWLLSQFQ
ncbi:hypothetical protein [Chlorogloeopsis sp. ULAP02]|uniref:hypothetical protein n=1 Tax=Chlorogloeopsis sp. ULAP02 TaxID=3107926 RepID=UPI0031354144